MQELRGGGHGTTKDHPYPFVFRRMSVVPNSTAVGVEQVGWLPASYIHKRVPRGKDLGKVKSNLGSQEGLNWESSYGKGESFGGFISFVFYLEGEEEMKREWQGWLRYSSSRQYFSQRLVLPCFYRRIGRLAWESITSQSGRYQHTLGLHGPIQ